jgi:WD40 repeat protein
MKILTVAGVAALLLLTGAQSAAPQRSYPYPPVGISWADAKHRHGWVTTESPRHRYCSRDASVLCATEDGGKHWRPIFRGGNYIFSYLRWSRNAGVVSAGARSHFELWTRDGGRHWWSTTAFNSGAYADASGFGAGPAFSRRAGQLRYAYSPRWPYRALGWVPTRRLRCAGKWERWSGETKGPRNICGFGPIGGDGMSSRPAGPAVRLRVTVRSETGDGLVRSNAAGIDCGTITPWMQPTHHGAACSSLFGKGSTVDLSGLTSVGAPPQSVQWTGCPRVITPPDPSAPSRCELTLTENAEVTASFHRSLTASAAPGANGLIAFEAHVKGFRTGLALIRAGGGGFRHLTRNRRDRAPTWSPDGARLAFERGSALYVMRADGNKLRRLVPRQRGGTQPAWSPNGHEIAFVRRGALYVMRSDGSHQHLLYRRRGVAVNRPSWSPNGKRIAVGIASTADADENLLYDYGSIVAIPRAGGRVVYVTDGRGEPVGPSEPGDTAEDRGPDWSPDGERIAFTRVVWLCPRCDQDEVYSAKLDGSDVAPITGDASPTSSPAWSPDGKFVAVDGLEIFTSGGKLVRSLHRAGSAPAWQPLRRR